MAYHARIPGLLAKRDLTSGVNMESGTSVQKKPRETQWVANLRMPK